LVAKGREVECVGSVKRKEGWRCCVSGEGECEAVYHKRERAKEKRRGKEKRKKKK
jgi:hypothetical protein